MANKKNSKPHKCNKRNSTQQIQRQDSFQNNEDLSSSSTHTEQQQQQQQQHVHHKDQQRNNNSIETDHPIVSSPLSSVVFSSNNHYNDNGQQQERTKYIDPMQCVDSIIPSRIFSFLTKKRYCSQSMKISKLWMERVPIYITHLWTQWNASKYVIKNTNSLLFQYLGPHVTTLIMSHFRNQQQHEKNNALNMMQMIKKNNSTQMTTLRKNDRGVLFINGKT